MTKQQAIKLIKAFFLSKEVATEEIDENNNYFQIQIETEIVAFNYRVDEETLTVSSLIYQFNDKPRPNVLETIQEIAKDETAGEIRFEEDNNILYIAKTYSENTDEEKFIDETQKIIDASRKWSSETLDHVASKVFHPEEIN